MNSDPIKISRARWTFSLLVLASFLVGFAIYYRSLITARRQRVLSSATSALASAADDLGTRLENWSTVVGNAARNPTKRGGSTGEEQFAKYIDVLVPGLDPATECSHNSASDAARAALSVRKGERFAFLFSAGSECAASDPQTTKSFFDALSGSFDTVPLASDDGEVYFETGRTGLKVGRLDSLISKSLSAPEREQNLLTSLLSILPAGEPAARTTSLQDKLLQQTAQTNGNSKTAGLTGFSDLIAVKGEGETFELALEPVPLVEFDDETTSVGVAPAQQTGSGGRTSSAASPGLHGKKHLVIAGLIRSAEIDRLSRVWPKDTAAWLMLAMLIIYCGIYAISWLPMKPRLQAVRPFDIASVALLTLVFCSASTLAVTHAYFDGVQNAKQDDLTNLAASMRDNFRQELCTFFHTLYGMSQSEDLGKAVRFKDAQGVKSDGAREASCVEMRNLLTYASNKDQKCEPDSDAQSSQERTVRASAIAYSYPFFDYVIWSMPEGSEKRGQIAKWSIRQELTPPTQMTQFEWFNRVKDRRFYRLHPFSSEERRLLGGFDSQDVVVAPVRSPNTGEYLTVLARPFDVGPVPATRTIGTIVAPLSSVNLPIFPPGYLFAVIEQNGTVLFSSDQKRNLRENLLLETGNDEGLMDILRARSARTLFLNLNGESVIAHYQPLDEVLEGANWGIVVYQSVSRNREIHQQVFLQVIGLLSPLMLEMLAMAAALLLVLSARKCAWLLPSRETGAIFWLLAIILMFVLALSWIITLSADRTELFWYALLLPPLCVMFAVALTAGRYRSAFSFACLYPVIAVWHVYLNGSARETASVLVIAIAFLIVILAFLSEGIAGKIAALCASLSETGKESIGLAFSGYSVAVSCGFVIIAVLPTIALYEVAFRMVNAAATLRSLVVTTHALEDRARAAAQYYKQIELPEAHTESPDSGTLEQGRFVKDRLASTLDVYRISSGTQAWVSAGGTRDDFAWVDRIALKLRPLSSALNFLALETPAGVFENSRESQLTRIDPVGQRAHLGKWPAAEFDYRSDLIQSDEPVDFERANGSGDRQSNIGMWKFHREASLAVDVGAGHSLLLWSVAGVSFFLLYLSIDNTLRRLYFVGASLPECWLKAKVDDLASLDRSVLVLTAGRKWFDDLILASARGGFDLVDLRQLGSIEDLPCFMRTSPQPIVLANLDFSFDSEKMMLAHLQVLEDLLFSNRKVVVLVTMIDPLDMTREMLLPEQPDKVRAQWFEKTEQRWERVLNAFERRRTTLEDDKDFGLASSIYSACTAAESSVIYQITHKLWVNPANRRALSNLVARGWVKGVPYPRLTDELTFLHDLAGSHPGLPGENTRRSWRFERPTNSFGATLLTMLAVGILVALVFAGKDLLQNGSGIVTGVVTGVPAVWRVYSTWRNRGEAPQKDA